MTTSSSLPPPFEPWTVGCQGWWQVPLPTEPSWVFCSYTYPGVYFYTVLRLMVFLLAKVSSAKIPLSLFCIGLLDISSETPLEEVTFSFVTGY